MIVEQIDMLRVCQPLTVTTVGEGFNAVCTMCWQHVVPGYCTPCSCATRGCWECGAAVGEPGCEYCAERAA